MAAAIGDDVLAVGVFGPHAGLVGRLATTAPGRASGHPPRHGPPSPLPRRFVLAVTAEHLVVVAPGRWGRRPTVLRRWPRSRISLDAELGSRTVTIRGTVTEPRRVTWLARRTPATSAVAAAVAGSVLVR